jgi:NAD(P)-dependent dehydrogenase (short-subunit alcohol dehydrogenase family)
MSENTNAFLNSQFGLSGKVAIVTGATGVLGGAMARGLAKAGAKVAIVGRRAELAEQVAAEINVAGGEAIGAPADVMSKDELVALRDRVLNQFGSIDILINAAGGGSPKATVTPEQSFFEFDMDGITDNVDLNLVGTMLPCMVLAEPMSKQKSGSIINISSMAVPRAMTRTVGYSAGKAAMENFTRWLAVELSLKYGEGLRVNAIAPGFFLGDQNRRLLTNEDGSLTPRGALVIHHTPARRFGEAEELAGAAIFLSSPAAAFINGAVLMVDGGVNAFSGI